MLRSRFIVNQLPVLHKHSDCVLIEGWSVIHRITSPVAMHEEEKKKMRILRTLSAVAAFVADVAFLYRYWESSSADKKSVFFEIFSLESLLVGGIALASCVLIIASWPVIVWCWKMPDRRAEKKKKLEEEKASRIVKALNDLVSVLDYEWAVLRGNHPPRETYTIHQVLDDLENAYGTARGFGVATTEAHVKSLSSIRCLKEEGIILPVCKDGQSRIWREDLNRLSVSIKLNGIKESCPLLRELLWKPYGCGSRASRGSRTGEVA